MQTVIVLQQMEPAIVEDSVYFLIVALCESLVRQYENINGNKVPKSILKRFKSQSYEIILKKSKVIGQFYNNQYVEINAERLFAQHIFAARLAGVNGCTEQQERLLQLEQKVDKILKSHSCSKAIEHMCQLLLMLHSNSNAANEGETNTHVPELLVPVPFTLHGNYENNPHYSASHINDSIMQPRPKYFTGVSLTKWDKHLCLPKSLFKNEPNILYELEQKYNFSKKTAIIEQSNTLQKIHVAPFRLYSDSGSHKSVNDFKSNGNDVRAVAPCSSNTQQVNSKEEKTVFSWNWENLALPNVDYSHLFSSESIFSFDMLGYYFNTVGHGLQAKAVSHQDIMQDLKALTVGIQSESFWYDMNLIFHIHNDVTIKGVLPATMQGFIDIFLQCGSCFKRLQIMTVKKSYKSMFEGFIYKALCSAVDEYLITFRQFIFSQEDKYLMEFHKRVKSSLMQIINLSLTLGVHPDIGAIKMPPLGSQFLSYLYQEIMHVTESEYLALLIYLLKQCCHVYFKYLQKWIYYGVLDDPMNELFICFLDHYRKNTRYFYEKAYFVHKESVPGFFQGYEDKMLQCGKYTILLKAFKPNHALFHMEYPAMSVCLSFEQIAKLDVDCKKYAQLTRECCGKPVTIREIFEVRAQNKRTFYQIASQRSSAYMEKWLSEQNALALDIAEQKKKRLEQLSIQLEVNKERKVAERRANVEFELKLLREAEKTDNLLLLGTNINLRKRIEYYQELSNLMSEGANADTKEEAKIPKRDEDNTNLNQQLHTPSSIVGTEFESCEEEENSEYTECISNDFVQHFSESEAELNAIYNRKTKNEEKENKNSNTIKHSVSDILNSNDPPTTMLQENRQHAMSGNEMAICIAQSNMQSAGDCVQTEKMEKIVVISDAQRNKLKVMSEEYGLFNPNCQINVPDINLNTLPDTELSEAQRNRKRIMETNPFSELCKSSLGDRSQLHLELDTELSRNRRKVLESEFNILTGSKTISTTTFAVADTPMSTTSDPPLSEVLVENERDDIQNVVRNSSTLAPLKLNTSHSRSQEIEADTAQIQVVSPEKALSIGGILGHDFDFIDINKSHGTEDAPIQNDKIKMQDNSNAKECYVQLQEDYSKSYNRSLELINSNFLCPIRQLWKSPLHKTDSNVFRGDGYKQFVPIDMNSMNAITLTEFLQQSVIKPMSIHFNILNSEVMRMFLEDLHILDHFRSLREYFFLMNGEFGAKICNGILEQLDGEGAIPQNLLNYQVLHSILDTALGSSIIGCNKHTAQLSFIVRNIPDHFDLNSPSVLQALSLSYQVDWPLNIILSPDVLEQYSIIFRYLFKVRRISWLLEHAYQLLKETTKTCGKQLLQSPQYRHIQLIRHKFYHFVHSLQNHITANALQASWKTFKDDLLEAKSIKDIFVKHTTYLRNILLLCMLNRRSVEFHNTIESIFKITLNFYNNLKGSDFKIESNILDHHYYIHSKYSAMADDELQFDQLIKHAIYLAERIVRDGDQTEIGEFIKLINYNQYYIKTF